MDKRPIRKEMNGARNPRPPGRTDADLLEAQAMGVEMILETPGVIPDPPPFAQIEALGDSNVLVRFHGWVDQTSADFLKVKGEAIRRAKTRLEDAGIDMSEPIYRVQMTQRAATESTNKSKSITHADDAKVDVRPDTAIDEQVEAHRNDEENLLEDERQQKK